MEDKKNKDLFLLSFFRKNSRESLTKISRKTSIPVSTIFDRLKAYENKLITRHTTLLDFDKLGFSARANVMLQIDADKRNEVKDYLLKSDNVNSLFKINNGFDYFVELIFKDMKELEEYLEDLEIRFPLKQKLVFYIIEDIAKEKFMAEPELVAMK